MCYLLGTQHRWRKCSTCNARHRLHHDCQLCASMEAQTYICHQYLTPSRANQVDTQKPRSALLPCARSRDAVFGTPRATTHPSCSDTNRTRRTPQKMPLIGPRGSSVEEAEGGDRLLLPAAHAVRMLSAYWDIVESTWLQICSSFTSVKSRNRYSSGKHRSEADVISFKSSVIVWDKTWYERDCSVHVARKQGSSTGSTVAGHWQTLARATLMRSSAVTVVVRCNDPNGVRLDLHTQYSTFPCLSREHFKRHAENRVRRQIAGDSRGWYLVGRMPVAKSIIISPASDLRRTVALARHPC